MKNKTFAFRVAVVLLICFLLVFSGYMGLVYLPDRPQRASLEDAAGIVQGARIVQIATSPNLPGVMLTGMNNRGGTPMYSLDSGQTWQIAPAPPWSKYYSPQQAAVARGNRPGEARLIVTGEAGGLETPHAVFSLTPGQSSWRKYRFPACPALYTEEFFSGLAISPADPRRVYVIRSCDDLPQDMHDGTSISHLFYQVFASKDGGQSFQQVYEKTVLYNPPIPDYRRETPGPVIPSPIEPERVYLGATLMSADGGDSWVATNFPISTLELDGVDADRLYGIHIEPGKPDIGLTRLRPVMTWKEWSSQPCEHIQQLVAHPTQAGVLLMRCGNNDNYSNGIRGYPFKEALLISTDSGDHWRELAGWSGNWIGPDYGSPGRMLWAREDGLWASTDLGENWSRLTADYRSGSQGSGWENLTPPRALLDSKLAAVSSDDIWAGDMWGGLLHWDGHAWNRVSYPHENPVRVYDLAFTASDNGWMVGEDNAFGNSRGKGVIYHWDGKAWTQSGTFHQELLRGVYATGSQAWVVGDNGLILHWDGREWSEMPNPIRQPGKYEPAVQIGLNAIFMITPIEGWAVGGNPYQNTRGVILHYKNGAWKQEYDTGSAMANFNAIHMVSAELGWAGGTNSSSSPDFGLLMRWDGQSWHKELSASSGFEAIDAASAQDAWAGGRDSLFHWNGQTWKAADLLPSHRFALYDLTMVPGGELLLTTQMEDVYNINFILRRR